MSACRPTRSMTEEKEVSKVKPILNSRVKLFRRTWTCTLTMVNIFSVYNHFYSRKRLYGYLQVILNRLHSQSNFEITVDAIVNKHPIISFRRNFSCIKRNPPRVAQTTSDPNMMAAWWAGACVCPNAPNKNPVLSTRPSIAITGHDASMWRKFHSLYSNTYEAKKQNIDVQNSWIVVKKTGSTYFVA